MSAVELSDRAQALCLLARSLEYHWYEVACYVEFECGEVEVGEEWLPDLAALTDDTLLAQAPMFRLIRDIESHLGAHVPREPQWLNEVIERFAALEGGAA